MTIDSCVREILDEIVAIRRDLHAHPETAYEEERTAGIIAAELRQIPLMEVEEGVGDTPGVVGVLRRDLPGPCVGLRADMDALAMEDACGQEWASTITGKAHTCGHDGHTAALIGAARVLGVLQERLMHPVKFIFQPAEEGGAGAERLCKAGVLKDPDVAVIYGMHGWPWLPKGTVGVASGPILAASTSMEITITGRGGHAAMPHQTVDPVYVSAQVITALQSIISRNLNPWEPGVISVCKVDAGSAFNVIPDSVHMLGTVRALSNETSDFLFDRIRETVGQVAAAFGAYGEVTFDDPYPATVNHPSALKAFKQSIKPEKVKVQKVEPVMGGEDFSFYGQQIPANFWFLGVQDSEAVETPLLHQPAYDFPDDQLGLAIKLHARSALGKVDGV